MSILSALNKQGRFSNLDDMFSSASSDAENLALNILFHGRSEIDIYFQSEAGMIKLPVNPPELKRTMQVKNETQDIVSLGEINVLGNAKLKDITIKSYFPYTGVISFLSGTGINYPPAYFVQFFEKAVKSKKPLKMVVTKLKISMLVSVESFDTSNVAGNHDDIQYELKLKEYKRFGAVKLKTTETADGTVAVEEQKNYNQEIASGAKEIPETAVVKEEGGIWEITKKKTGSDEYWQELYENNKDVFVTGIGTFIGKTIKIPEVIRNANKNYFTE